MSTTFQLTTASGPISDQSDDIAIDAIGALVPITGLAKLEQDILKILRTATNNFYPNYETEIDSLIGGNYNVDEIKQTLANNITNSLVYLQYLQQQQQKYQILDAAEVLETINSIAVTYLGDITPTGTNLTTYTVAISVTNAAQNTVTISTTSQAGRFD